MMPFPCCRTSENATRLTGPKASLSCFFRRRRFVHQEPDARKIVAAPTDPVTTGGIQHANQERGNLPI
jgi:hypothetical protein